MPSVDNKCSYQDNTKTEAVSKLSDILTNAGISSCRTTLEEAKTWAKMNSELTMFPIIGPKGKNEIDIGTGDRAESNQGCESVIAINEEYRKTVNNVKCTFESIKSEAKNQLTAINSINITDKAIIDCGNESFDIDQRINTKSLSATSLSTAQLQEITNNVVDGLKSTADQIIKQESGFGGTPQGLKSIKNIQSELNSADVQNRIRDNIQSTLNSMFAQNKLNIAGKIRGRGCKMTQSIIAELVASTVVNDAFQNIFESFIEGSIEHSEKLALESKTEGAPPIDTPSSKDNNILMYSLIGVGVFVVLLFLGFVLYFLFFRNRNNDDDYEDDYNGYNGYNGDDGGDDGGDGGDDDE